MLVPNAFAVHANTIWTAMGSPMPNFHNAWAIYTEIRDTMKSMQHQLGPLLSDSSQFQDQDSDNIGDTSLLIDWEDFSDDQADDAYNNGSDAEPSGPIADLTEDEDDAEGHSIGLA
jgi:hypothetical protein